MYSAKVNKRSTFQIDSTKTGLKIDGADVPLDLAQLSNGDYHLLSNGRSYRIELLSMEQESKTVVLRINGMKYTVALKDQFDALLQQLGMDNLNTTKVNDVKAPMPGLVLRILVNEGDIVKKGDGLLVLEAMKMENIIKASGDATIKKVQVKSGDKVEKNQVLINMA